MPTSASITEVTPEFSHSLVISGRFVRRIVGVLLIYVSAFIVIENTVYEFIFLVLNLLRSKRNKGVWLFCTIHSCHV